VSESGAPVALQARVLDRWGDGSARWALLDWLADAPGERAATRVEIGEGAPAAPGGPRVEVREEAGGACVVETGAATFRLAHAGRFPFESVEVGGAPAIDAARSGLRVEDGAGRTFEATPRAVTVEERGPIRACIRVAGDLASPGAPPLCRFLARLHFVAGSPVVRFHLTLHNPRRAQHPGGLWDLGDPGSILLKDASLVVAGPGGEGPPDLRFSAEAEAPFERAEASFEVYQDSSGGEAWKSRNHLNRRREIPLAFRGYRIRAGGAERTGLRATPIATWERGGRALAIAVEEFWQNFPKSLEADAAGVTLRLFPKHSLDLHELQGGEQKTHVFHVAFGHDAIAREPLEWARRPLVPRLDPAWTCATGAVTDLLPREECATPVYEALVGAALDGDDTFERKREVVDEYGWRHFGDIWGDHEAVFHEGPEPLLSHYNNQYDPLLGMALQHLRSGDPRWWIHMRQSAAHTIDIDTYHTDEDKAAYNHGLFWHTVHYVDADIATHRSYPSAGKVCGGGPANEQMYSTGLLHHFLLTGDELSREIVLAYARFALDIDDGSRTIFRWLDRGPTGLASQTGNPLYHGPGRGPGNLIGVLVDAHRLTGEARWLAKAEELIRRCTHPRTDIAALTLHDAERRWYYTVYLQALAKYLEHKAELGLLDGMYAYGRATLLHFARWMAAHEYPTLDKPEVLEFPTETWAAQDMRKSEVLCAAAKHASGEERARFLERGAFFFRYSTTTLTGMKTRTLCRPVVLLMSFGLKHAYMAARKDAALPAPPPGTEPADWGAPERFEPQKPRAIRRAKVIAVVGALVALAGAALLVRALLG